MKKILFAMNMREAEKFISDSLAQKAPGEYNIVGSAIHKEILPEKMRLTTPDILIVREGLGGPENLFDLVCELRVNYPQCRIIFIAGNRKPGDKNLQKLASFGVLDIIFGTKPNINLVIKMILEPSTFDYAKQFLTDASAFSGFDSNENKQNEEKPQEETIISTSLIVEDKQKNKKGTTNGGIIAIPNKANDENENLLTEVESLRAELEALRKSKTTSMNPKSSVDKSGKRVDVASLPPKPPKTDGLGSFGRKSYEPRYSGKDKIVTFFGAKSGIGTTTVAYNVALELAYRRKNVLYIEVNDTNPMIAYWYDVYNNLALNNGIDKAVLGFETGISKDIDESLITRDELIQNSGDLSANFKKFPPTLDYLFFSAEYIEAANKPIISSNSFSQVLLYFMQQLNYNYLILDINSHIDQSLIETSLTFSNKNYIVVSQEFSSIGYYERFFEILRRKGLDFSKKENGKKDLSDKNSFIVNRHVKAGFDIKEIKEWLDNPEVFKVCDASRDIIDLSFNCEPIIKNLKYNKQFHLDIAQIVDKLELS